MKSWSALTWNPYSQISPWMTSCKWFRADYLKPPAWRKNDTLIEQHDSFAGAVSQINILQLPWRANRRSGDGISSVTRSSQYLHGALWRTGLGNSTEPTLCMEALRGWYLLHYKKDSGSRDTWPSQRYMFHHPVHSRRWEWRDNPISGHQINSETINTWHSRIPKEDQTQTDTYSSSQPSDACEEGICEESVQLSPSCHAEQRQPARRRGTSRWSPAGEWLPQTIHREIPGETTTTRRRE